MDIEAERKRNEKIKELLDEIEFRESTLRQLTFDRDRKTNFWRCFMAIDLKLKTHPPLKRFKNEVNVFIDSDIELQNDIIVAFENSKKRLEKEFKSDKGIITRMK